MVRTWALVGLVVIGSFGWAGAETILDVRFEQSQAVDQGGGAAVEPRNIVFTENGGKECAEFDGASALLVPHDPRLNFGASDLFWAELWLNPLNLTKAAILLIKGSGTNYSVVLNPDGGVSLSYYSRGDWQVVSSVPSSVPLETWSHLAIYFDSPSGRAVLFVNGVVIGVAADLPPFQSGQDLPLYIGGQPVGEAGMEFSGFDGEMAEIRLGNESPWTVSSDLKVGDSAFQVPPLF